MVIDAEGMKSVEVREQRGEGDASHYNRIYKKNLILSLTNRLLLYVSL